MDRCIKTGIILMLMYITLVNLTTARSIDNSRLSATLSKYKKMTQLLQKRHGALPQEKRINLMTRGFLLAKADADGNQRYNTIRGRTDDDGNKRQVYDDDYGLGGGRFGKRSNGYLDDYDSRDERFDHEDISDV
ncbi:uncharacterized protein LOC115211114 [Argonauta hians]